MVRADKSGYRRKYIIIGARVESSYVDNGMGMG